MASVRSALEAYPRPFWALVVGTFVNRTGLVVIPFLALFLTAERGYSVQLATLAVSLYGGGAFTGGLAGGWLSDRIGRRPVLLLSLGGAAAPVAAIPFAPTFATIAATSFAFGFLGEMYRPAVSAVVADLLPGERRARGYAVVYWAINLGAAIGPALGGWLASRSYTGLFVLEGVTLLGYAALIAVEVPETKPVEAEGASVVLDLGPVARDGALAAVSVAVLLVGIGFFQLFTTLPIVMTDLGLSEFDFGLVVAVNGGLIVLVGLPVAAYVGERMTSLWVPASVALMALGIACQVPASTFWAYAACAVIWTVGEMAFLPVVPTIVAGLAPTELRGSYQGVYHAAWGLSKMIAPALGGLVLANASSSALWGGSAALVAAASVVLLALLPTLRRRLVLEDARPVEVEA
ncbi:MDR family MFS transporter [Rubrivirga sp.]|uniref:MDR family MFS transporter n=1 Tax=Rubrivirga sp. TaxID=1885344 RepID=UPI003C72EE82